MVDSRDKVALAVAATVVVVAVELFLFKIFKKIVLLSIK